ncbi:hypothetical protein [Paracoccus sp. IB05]|uniref:hypothetical protein n=1 Tax=Paracoccus sp. IB05 TaxID=2779367 RepID=UPI0018E79536|nr:hypothetical protein [Paracoccus sp. IB05]MBJ2151614.1 hypothetical protein [Paracoccus sp. IB05]
MPPIRNSGDPALTIGASYLSDRARTTERDVLPRDARRSEMSLFARGVWTVTDEVAVTGGLPYSHFNPEDFNTNIVAGETPATRSGESADPSIGIAGVVEPIGCGPI